MGYVFLTMIVRPGLVNEGILEVVCGPMKCGKSLELLTIIERVERKKRYFAKVFRPKIDGRTKHLQSRFGGVHHDGCIIIEESEPLKILKYVEESDDIVIIDEAEFFQNDLLKAVDNLLSKNVNVVTAGLDLDFRGETFGVMGDLLARADYVYKMTADCDYENSSCKRRATRTQKLINGRPAFYVSDDKIISVEGSKKGETYEARCIEHHFVPNKPKLDNYL
jgi:thymidine kinase